MGISDSLKRAAGHVERLSHISVKPAGEVKAAGRKVKELASDAKQAIDDKRQEYKENQEYGKFRREADELQGFKDRKDRTRKAEFATFGRELTASERSEFAKFKKETAAKKHARGSNLFGGANKVHVKGPPHKGSAYDIIAGGGSSSHGGHQKKSSKPKRNVDWSLGGMIGSRDGGKKRGRVSPF